jgi:cytochrome c peroxidase
MGGQSFEKPINPAAFYADLGREPVKDDFGRFNETKDEADRYKMKVPNLRNLAITFPYLHDGSTSDLRDVVRLMADHFVPELNRRRMTDEDVGKIVAMLNQNTGTLHGKSLAP